MKIWVFKIGEYTSRKIAIEKQIDVTFKIVTGRC